MFVPQGTQNSWLSTLFHLAFHAFSHKCPAYIRPPCINIYTPSPHLALTQVSLSPPVSCFSIMKYADVIAMGYCFLALSWNNSGNWDPREISEISPSEWLAELLKITDQHNSSKDYCNIGENIPEQVISIYSNSLKTFPVYNFVYLT